MIGIYKKRVLRGDFMEIKDAIKWFEDELKDGKCSDECPQCNANEMALEALRMTEKEMILNILKRIQLKNYCAHDDFIEFSSGYGYETIMIDFDENGNVIGVGC
jgi:predicted nucleic-acid-binding Zn-ribbon protein